MEITTLYCVTIPRHGYSPDFGDYFWETNIFNLQLYVRGASDGADPNLRIFTQKKEAETIALKLKQTMLDEK